MKKPLLILAILNAFIFTNADEENGTNLFPDYIPSNTCYLETHRTINIIGWDMNPFNSTGVLIDNQYLVTAGHNIYDSWITTLKKVKVICKSINGKIENRVIDREMIEQTRKISHYDKNNHTFAFDYAFLKLATPMNVKESVSLNSNKNINDIKFIEVAGYPNGQLRYGKGKVEKINKNTFNYTVKTVKGMSGGPVWSGNKLLGIHVSNGMARTVNKELIDDFNQWKKSFQK